MQLDALLFFLFCLVATFLLFQQLMLAVLITCTVHQCIYDTIEATKNQRNSSLVTETDFCHKDLTKFPILQTPHQHTANMTIFCIRLPFLNANLNCVLLQLSLWEWLFGTKENTQSQMTFKRKGLRRLVTVSILRYRLDNYQIRQSRWIPWCTERAPISCISFPQDTGSQNLDQQSRMCPGWPGCL
jgi:hypothetical protein